MDFQISDTFENGMKWDRKLEELSWCWDYTTCHRKYRSNNFSGCLFKVVKSIWFHLLLMHNIMQWNLSICYCILCKQHHEQIHIPCSICQADSVCVLLYIPIQSMLWLLTTRKGITSQLPSFVLDVNWIRNFQAQLILFPDG